MVLHRAKNDANRCLHLSILLTWHVFTKLNPCIGLFTPIPCTRSKSDIRYCTHSQCLSQFHTTSSSSARLISTLDLSVESRLQFATSSLQARLPSVLDIPFTDVVQCRPPAERMLRRAIYERQSERDANGAYCVLHLLALPRSVSFITTSSIINGPLVTSCYQSRGLPGPLSQLSSAATPIPTTYSLNYSRFSSSYYSNLSRTAAERIVPPSIAETRSICDAWSDSCRDWAVFEYASRACTTATPMSFCPSPGSTFEYRYALLSGYCTVLSNDLAFPLLYNPTSIVLSICETPVNPMTSTLVMTVYSLLRKPISQMLPLY